MGRVTKAAGDPLSIMSLLKLSYISHGWYLALCDAPLFSDRIEAWRHGPVIPKMYKDFRRQGIRPSKFVKCRSADVDEQQIDFLEQIYDIYGALPPFHLSALTHVAGGPWDITYRMGGLFAEIPNDLIKMHYLAKQNSSGCEDENQSSH